LKGENARKTFSKSGIHEMQASILAHGLIENLVVTEGDDGKYYVVAGGRRLTAMKGLQKEGKLPDDFEVACKVKEDEQAAELSLAENVIRQAMPSSRRIRSL
jgi:ParB family transcriptional regulator, chromosome partitioning protein